METKKRKRERVPYTFQVINKAEWHNMFGTERTLKENVLQQRQRLYLKNIRIMQGVIVKMNQLDRNNPLYLELERTRKDLIRRNEELLEVCKELRYVANAEGQKPPLRDDEAFLAYQRGQELFNILPESELIKVFNAEEAIENVIAKKVEVFDRFVKDYLRRKNTSELKEYLNDILKDHLVHIQGSRLSKPKD